MRCDKRTRLKEYPGETNSNSNIVRVTEKKERKKVSSDTTPQEFFVTHSQPVYNGAKQLQSQHVLLLNTSFRIRPLRMYNLKASNTARCNLDLPHVKTEKTESVYHY
eukprot:scpid107427/ scgid12862/ 